jgi:replicative DNA helicase
MLSIVKNEQLVLNCIWETPELIYKFDKNYFISDVAFSIFESIKELYENKVNYSINDVVALGNAKNNLVTKENLESLRKQDFDLGSFEYYFKTLKKNYAKGLIEDKLLKETLIEVSSKGELNVEKLESLISEMEKNLDLIKGKDSLLRSLEEVTTNYQGILIRRQRGEYKFPTGDSHLDRFLATGYAPGEITTFFAASGVGKSVYALNQISRQINKRIPSLYLTLEMSEIATMDRMIALRQKVPASFFRLNEDDELPEEAFKLLKNETDKLRAYKDSFFLVDDPSLSLSDFEMLVKEAQKKMKTQYLIATIDLFTMLSDVGQKADEIEEAMNMLHKIAKRNRIHVVIIVQANRNADSAKITNIEQIHNLRPAPNTIKNSQAIFERSRLVISLFRPKYYAQRLFPESEELDLMDDILELQILKQSNGNIGQVIKYIFDAETFRVYPYLEEEDI